MSPAEKGWETLAAIPTVHTCRFVDGEQGRGKVGGDGRLRRQKQTRGGNRGRNSNLEHDPRGIFPNKFHENTYAAVAAGRVYWHLKNYFCPLYSNPEIPNTKGYIATKHGPSPYTLCVRVGRSH